LALLLELIAVTIPAKGGLLATLPGASDGEELGASAPFILLEVSSRTCYFSFMSERLYSKSCSECGGVCPLQARACKYCNFSFHTGRTFSLKWRAARGGPLGKVAIWIAILMIVALIVMNVLRG